MDNDKDDICNEKELAEFEHIVKNADKNLKSEVKKIVEKRRSQLVSCDSSSSSSKQSVGFGSSTLSSISSSKMTSSNESNDDSVFVSHKDSLVTNIEDVDLLSLVDISEELLSLSSESSVIFNIQSSLKKKYKKNRSSLLNSTINTCDVSSNFLSEEANKIISEIENDESNSPRKNVQLLDLEKLKELLESPSSNYALKIKQAFEKKENLDSTSFNEEFLAMESEKVLQALDDAEFDTAANTNPRMTILDLEKLNDSLISSPLKDLDKSHPKMSTPKPIKLDKEKLYQNILKLLGKTETKKIGSGENAADGTFLKSDLEKLTDNIETTFVKDSQDDFKNKKSKDETFVAADLDHRNVKVADSTFVSKGESTNNVTKTLSSIPSGVHLKRNNLNGSFNIDEVKSLNETVIINTDKNKDEKNVINATFDADKSLDATFSVVGNGSFIVEGKVTNLMDMESDQLDTVIQSIPADKKDGTTPVTCRKSSFYKKDKESFISRLSLLGRLPTNNSQEDSKPIKRAHSETEDKLKNKELLGRSEFLSKLRKKIGGSSGPQGPMKVIRSDSDGKFESGKVIGKKVRAVSTPVAACVDNSRNSLQGRSDDDSTGGRKNKFPSLPSFGSVSSIEERPNTFNVASDGSLGTPEVFRSRNNSDGPGLTSTPAMSMKGTFSRILTGIPGANIPTPIVAPKDMIKYELSPSETPPDDKEFVDNSPEICSEHIDSGLHKRVTKYNEEDEAGFQNKKLNQDGKLDSKDNKIQIKDFNKLDEKTKPTEHENPRLSEHEKLIPNGECQVNGTFVSDKNIVKEISSPQSYHGGNITKAMTTDTNIKIPNDQILIQDQVPNDQSLIQNIFAHQVDSIVQKIQTEKVHETDCSLKLANKEETLNNHGSLLKQEIKVTSDKPPCETENTLSKTVEIVVPDIVEKLNNRTEFQESNTNEEGNKIDCLKDVMPHSDVDGNCFKDKTNTTYKNIAVNTTINLIKSPSIVIHETLILDKPSTQEVQPPEAGKLNAESKIFITKDGGEIIHNKSEIRESNSVKEKSQSLNRVKSNINVQSLIANKLASSKISNASVNKVRPTSDSSIRPKFMNKNITTNNSKMNPASNINQRTKISTVGTGVKSMDYKKIIPQQPNRKSLRDKSPKTATTDVKTSISKPLNGVGLKSTVVKTSEGINKLPQLIKISNESQKDDKFTKERNNYKQSVLRPSNSIASRNPIRKTVSDKDIVTAFKNLKVSQIDSELSTGSIIKSSNLIPKSKELLPSRPNGQIPCLNNKSNLPSSLNNKSNLPSSLNNKSSLTSSLNNKSNLPSSLNKKSSIVSISKSESKPIGRIPVASKENCKPQNTCGNSQLPIRNKPPLLTSVKPIYKTGLRPPSSNIPKYK